MSANTPSSLFASLTIHAFVAALIFLSTIYMARQAKEQPAIFELVAGPATAPDELVAPARGNTPNQLNTYISLLIQELKRAHEPPPGVSDRLEAKVTFDITASGAILNPRITKSSGDKAFDESVLEAFLRMRSIGPTPNRRADTWTVTFKMRDDS